MMDDRVMIFIDSENLLYATRAYGGSNGTTIKVDYVKMIDKLANGRSLKRAYVYGSLPPDDNESQVKFHRWLNYQGIRTNIIPLKRRSDSFTCSNCGAKNTVDKYVEKGVDVALASDMLSLGFKNAYDVAILVAGDYDYHIAIDVLQRNGIIVDIAFFRNHNISNEFVRCADHFIDLENMINDIKK